MLRTLLTLVVLTLVGPLCAADLTQRMEAESAKYSTCTITNDAKYSGGKALRLTEGNARITFTVDVDATQRYKLFVAGNGVGGEKVINCIVNGSTATFRLNAYAEAEVGTFVLKAGSNKVEITPNWTWFDIDYLRLEAGEAPKPFVIAEHPVDTAATPEACALYALLRDNFGKRTISGIMTGDMTSANGNVTRHADVQAVYKKAGVTPALIGFDFMNATGKDAANSWNVSYTRSAFALAKDTYRRGGIPAFTWHWRDPSRSTDAFYSDQSTVHITSALRADGTWNTASPLYRNMIRDIDAIADYFLEMQREGMACIFRPLHEASGGWFWWGRDGAKPFKQLYRLMYDEMVGVKGVHNVLWVWNAGVDDADWNPGEEYYDIVSADIYNNQYDYSSCYPTFDQLKALTEGRKIIALSENGPIPDIQQMADDGAMWSWWMPWYQTWNGGFVDKTSAAEWRSCMNDERVITLEDLSAGWQGIETIENEATPASPAMYDIQGRRLRNIHSRGFYISGGKVITAPHAAE